jgi:hypothetical protein
MKYFKMKKIIFIILLLSSSCFGGISILQTYTDMTGAMVIPDSVRVSYFNILTLDSIGTEKITPTDSYYKDTIQIDLSGVSDGVFARYIAFKDSDTLIVLDNLVNQFIKGGVDSLAIIAGFKEGYSFKTNYGTHSDITYVINTTTEDTISTITVYHTDAGPGAAPDSGKVVDH